MKCFIRGSDQKEDIRQSPPRSTEGDTTVRDSQDQKRLAKKTGLRPSRMQQGDATLQRRGMQLLSPPNGVRHLTRKP